MAPGYPHVRRRLAPSRSGGGAPLKASSLKRTGVGENDRIRVLKPAAVRLYRDGMTVGQFAAAVGDVRAALKQLVSSHKAGLIVFQSGRRPKA